MRKRIYKIVHIYDDSIYSLLYKYFMVGLIIVSFLPLMSKKQLPLFKITDGICLVFFSIDYFLRLITADYKLKTTSWKAFLKFPFRMISLIDKASIFALMSSVFSWKLSGIAHVLTIFRIIRLFRYSKSLKTIIDILKRSRKQLMAVGSFAIGYIILSAVLVFNVEPDSFNTFFDAVYWSTISLTTVGYGDLYPVTIIGRSIAMLSSFFGIAIVALPAGIITAGYMNTLHMDDDDD